MRQKIGGHGGYFNMITHQFIIQKETISKKGAN